MMGFIVVVEFNFNRVCVIRMTIREATFVPPKATKGEVILRKDIRKRQS